MNGAILLRYSGWGRVFLAVAALGLNLAFGSPLLLAGGIAAYLIYAVIIALRSHGLRGISGLLVLFADLLFFVVLAGASAAAVWVAPAVLLYLLAEALAFYSPVEMAVIVGICAVFCAAFSRPGLREVGAGGAGSGTAGLRRRPEPAEPDARVGRPQPAGGAGGKRSRQGARRGAAAHRFRFPRRPAAELYQPADAAGDSA